MKTEKDTVTRTIPIGIYFPRGKGCKGKCTCPECEKSRSLYRQFRNANAIYRQTCRKGASILYLAEAAASTIKKEDGDIKIIPMTHDETKTYKNGDKKGQEHIVKVQDSKKLLEMVFHKTGELHAYSMRDWIKKELGEGVRSEMADAVRDDIIKVWQSKDAEFPTASRGYLCLNFARRVGQFQGIGVPVRSAAIKFTQHTFSFSLIPGEWMEANIGTLDGSRWGVIKKIQSGEWKMGDPVRISYKDNELMVYMTYSRPPERISGLDPNRELECAFSTEQDKFIQFRVREGQKTYIDDLRFDSLNAAAALEFIDRLSKQTNRILENLKSCGSRTERMHGSGNPVAHQAISDRSKKVSTTRENGCRTWNHTWSHRAINVATKWSCSSIKVFDIPENLFGRSWQWADFKSKLEYKAKECGIKLEFVKSPTTKEVANVL